MYYANKLESLKRIFGSDTIELKETELRVGDVVYPIFNDVIITLDPSRYTNQLKRLLPAPVLAQNATEAYAPDIQSTFGEEWTEFNTILPEHYNEFGRYFDIVDLSGYRQKTVCDLGCGNGRWSYYFADQCREIILVDFSDAIFTARNNLRGKNNALFIMADINQLPFRNDFADFLFCIGVLHHLPTPALSAVRALQRFAPELLIYLYYALDNRPWYFRVILSIITSVRLALSKIKNNRIRRIISWFGAYAVYWPLARFGAMVERLTGRGQLVPLYEGYRDKSIERIKQDVYDRFFTRIEQRVSNAEIEQLCDTFSSVIISPREPYWHFLCRR